VQGRGERKLRGLCVLAAHMGKPKATSTEGRESRSSSGFGKLPEKLSAAVRRWRSACHQVRRDHKL